MNCSRRRMRRMRKRRILSLKKNYLKNSCLTSLILMNSYLHLMILSCMSGLKKIRTTSKVYRLSCSENVLRAQNSF